MPLPAAVGHASFKASKEEVTKMHHAPATYSMQSVTCGPLLQVMEEKHNLYKKSSTANAFLTFNPC